jgi:hypothetical protein
VLRDPRRYGIENTTGKVCRPGAVRRRRDVVCTEHIVGNAKLTSLVQNRRCWTSSARAAPAVGQMTISPSFARYPKLLKF